MLRTCSREVTERWISHRFGKLWVIRQVKCTRFERQLSLLSGRNLEIFLDLEVKIVSARVADIGKKPWRVAEGLGKVTAEVCRWGRIDQAWSRTCTCEVHGLIVKPLVHAPVRPRDRPGVTDEAWAIRQHASAAAVAVRVISYAKWGTRADGVDSAHAPATEYIRGKPAVQPFLTGTKGQLYY